MLHPAPLGQVWRLQLEALPSWGGGTGLLELGTSPDGQCRSLAHAEASLGHQGPSSGKSRPTLHHQGRGQTPESRSLSGPSTHYPRESNASYICGAAASSPGSCWGRQAKSAFPREAPDAEMTRSTTRPWARRRGVASPPSAGEDPAGNVVRPAAAGTRGGVPLTQTRRSRALPTASSTPAGERPATHEPRPAAQRRAPGTPPAPQVESGVTRRPVCAERRHPRPGAPLGPGPRRTHPFMARPHWMRARPGDAAASFSFSFSSCCCCCCRRWALVGSASCSRSTWAAGRPPRPAPPA